MSEEENKRIELNVERMKIAGLYVDTFSTLQWNGHVRITFGETGPYGIKSWRSAVVIEKDLMLRLAKRLLEILKEQENDDQPEGSEGDGQEGKE